MFKLSIRWVTLFPRSLLMILIILLSVNFPFYVLAQLSKSIFLEDINFMNGGIYAGKHFNEWKSLLKSPSPRRRLSAARAMGEMGPNAVGAISDLTVLLADQDEFIRSASAHALGSIGPRAKTALPNLIKALKEASYLHRGIIGPSIANIGQEAVVPLLDCTSDNDSGIRFEAVRAIGLIRPPAVTAVPRLQDLLTDRDGKIREEAAFALWTITHDQSAITVIADGLKNSKSFVRMRAADHLAEIGSEALPALPILISALGDGEESVRSRSARAITRIGPLAKDAVPSLLRFSDAESISLIGHAAIPALIESIRNHRDNARIIAADVLGRIKSPMVDAAIPLLSEMVNEPEAKARMTAGMALWRINRSDRIVPILSQALISDELSVQLLAMQYIQEIGSSAKDTVPALIVVLEKGNQSIRREAAISLGMIGPEAKDAVPALTVALGDRAASLRVASALSLWRIAHVKTALSSLIHDLQAPDDPAFVYAIGAFAKVGPEAKAAVPVLVQHLRDDPDKQMMILNFFASLGTAAESALPALIEAFNDENALHRNVIAETIKAITPLYNP